MSDSKEDRSLVSKISDGDKQAFEQLFNKYFQYLHNVAYNRLKSEEVAEDIVQNIFTDLWKNRKSLDVHTSAKSYLFQAVKNQIYKFIRHKSVREKDKYIKIIHDKYYTQNPFPKSNDLMEVDELKQIITKQLATLPSRSRNIFQLSREKNYTYKEIAERLNCSPKTVEYHISKVLKHLRVNLKDYTAVLIPLAILLLL